MVKFTNDVSDAGSIPVVSLCPPKLLAKEDCVFRSFCAKEDDVL